LDHRAKYVGARRLSNQKIWLAVVSDEAALNMGFSPKGLRFISAAGVHLPYLDAVQLDNLPATASSVSGA
jgi:hypothetical protein